MSTSQSPLLEVNDLEVRFKVSRPGSWRHSVVRAVDGVSFDIERGQTLGLVGESGSGKSTTGRAVLQLVPAHAGSIQLEGVDLATSRGKSRRLLRERVQMVFQDPYTSLNQRMRVGDIIAEPLHIHRVGDQASRRRRVADLADLVGLPTDSKNRYPHEFSGGQRQRIGIARALAIEPSLVICDEPVAALDVSIQAQIIRLLKDLQREIGVSYLFIAHDLNVVRHLSQRTAVMYLGKVVEHGASGSVFSNPRHPYTQALTSATPVPDPDSPRRRTVLQGEIPSPTAPPSGCSFRTRCPHARPLCADETPILETTGDGVTVACHYWREIGSSTPAPTINRPNLLD